MIPQGDPHPSTPRPPRPHRGARLRAYRHEHPRAFGVRALGAFLVLFCSFILLWFVRASGEWQAGLVLTAVLVVFCAIGATVSVLFPPPDRSAEPARRATGFTDLPADTDAATLAEAWRLVRKGALGPDPETNRLGRLLVEQELDRLKPAYAVLYLTLATLFLNTVYCVNRILSDGVSTLLVLVLVLNALLPVLLTVVPFMTARQRRHAEAFRDAYDHAADEAPDTTA